MKAEARTWGNSLAVRIPRALADDLGLADGDDVELSLEGDKLVIQRAPESGIRLEDLLARVSEDNLHSALDTGPAVGSEAW